LEVLFPADIAEMTR